MERVSDKMGPIPGCAGLECARVNRTQVTIARWDEWTAEWRRVALMALHPPRPEAVW